MSIFKKLLEIQAESIKLKKDADNPFFKSQYITLDNIIDTYNPILNSKGIVCLHQTENNKLVTMLYDVESETSVRSEFSIYNQDPQKQWSEITYGKRYNLWQLLNIQTDLDDDGNLASSSGNTKQFYTKKVDKPQETDDKKWFNEPEFTEFQKVNVYWDIDSALKAIKTKYKLSKVMEEKVRKIYDISNPPF